MGETALKNYLNFHQDALWNTAIDPVHRSQDFFAEHKPIASGFPILTTLFSFYLCLKTMAAILSLKQSPKKVRLRRTFFGLC